MADCQELYNAAADAEEAATVAYQNYQTEEQEAQAAYNSYMDAEMAAMMAWDEYWMCENQPMMAVEFQSAKDSIAAMEKQVGNLRNAIAEKREWIRTLLISRKKRE